MCLAHVFLIIIFKTRYLPTFSRTEKKRNWWEYHDLAHYRFFMKHWYRGWHAQLQKKEEIRKNQRILNLYRSLYSFTYYFYSTVFWIQNQRNQKLWSNSDTIKRSECKGEKGDFFGSGISYISVGIKIEALSVK